MAARGRHIHDRITQMAVIPIRNLVLDAGNSALKVGLFEEKNLLSAITIGYDNLEPLRSLIQTGNPAHALMIASSDRDSAVLDLLARHTDIWVDVGLKNGPLPFETDYQTPDTLGDDRLAGVAGSVALYGLDDALVVQMGTCLTYDMLINGKHRGGAISPGVGMRFKAMHHFTAKLPSASLPASFPGFPAKTTNSSLETGVVHGVVAELESFILQATQYSEKINVILTGGDSQWFAPRLKSAIFALPNLNLIGLNEILLHRK